MWHVCNSAPIGQATYDAGAPPIQSWLRDVFLDFHSLVPSNVHILHPHLHTHTQHSLGSALSGSMSYPLVILLCVGLLHPTARAVLMDKLADNKICGDAECSCKSEHAHFILRIITLNKMLVFHCSFCPLYFLFLFCLLCMIRCSVHGHGLG